MGGVMKRWLLAVVALAVAGLGVTLIARTRGPQWTTDSPEALAAVEAANEASMKLYYDDAVASLRTALELDPDFVYPKLALTARSGWVDKDTAERYLGDLRAADLDDLTHRERCLVERFLAVRDGEREQAIEILDACLEADPDDVFLLSEKAAIHWAQGDMAVAERLYRRIVELNPNWVVAYNQLGYTTMIQERFVEAREYFVSYRYIAPDQANPHDSLGELYIIQGQREDARLSLEHALEIKPDFWASYEHLVIVLSLMGRYDEAGDVVERMVSQPGYPDTYPERLRCFIEAYRLFDRNADREALELADSGCAEEPYSGFITIAAHRAAVRLGDWERAEAFESAIRELNEKPELRQKWMEEVGANLLHMEGVRLAARGEHDAAVDRFRRADEMLEYRETGPGLLKLHNRLAEVEALLAAGRDVEGHRLLGEVRFVNPVMVDEFEARGLEVLGRSRG
jgi:tetratricopeptide (TPR) repeat protein